jgi:pilus assembly protein CpaF
MRLRFADDTIRDISGLTADEAVDLGSARSCDIRCDAEGVARIHCRITRQENDMFILPLQDIRVNGTPVSEKRLLRFGDQLEVGGMTIRVEAADRSQLPSVNSLKSQIKRALLERHGVKRFDATVADADALKKRALETIDDIMAEMRPLIGLVTDYEKLRKDIVADTLGLGPLEDLLARDDISEIMVNGPSRVYVEVKGRLQKTDVTFEDDEHLVSVIERIVSPLGRRIDESSPLVDARLADGSRVNATIPPIALDGPTLNIRKFSKVAFSVDDYVRFGSMTHEIAYVLKTAVHHRLNVIISGGTGSGKTTLLNLLASFIRPDERILTIEDSAELRLPQEHIVRFEARPANIEGSGMVTIRDLVKNSLRMRPDRIVVGECRGGEAVDMLQAMNTGHDGSLTTVHANSPADALARLETMVLMSGVELPSRAIREQIASAVNLIVQVSRCVDGTRKLLSVIEIHGINPGGEIAFTEICRYVQTAYSPEKGIEGHFACTGNVPCFMQKLIDAGIELDVSMFKG